MEVAEGMEVGEVEMRGFVVRLEWGLSVRVFVGVSWVTGGYLNQCWAHG